MPRKPRIITPTVQIHYDTDPNTPEDIEAYIHCERCIDEWKQSLKGAVSPREYARTQIGIRADGSLQVVCTRHNCNVAVLTFGVVDRQPQ